MIKRLFGYSNDSKLEMSIGTIACFFAGAVFPVAAFLISKMMKSLGTLGAIQLLLAKSGLS